MLTDVSVQWSHRIVIKSTLAAAKQPREMYNNIVIYMCSSTTDSSRLVQLE